jgi:hypothetical protein
VLITFFYGFLIVAIAAVVAVVGLRLSQKHIPLHFRERNNTATGAIYAALCVMFGVSVGFTLILTWEEFNQARLVAENEAIAVEQVYFLSESIPETDRTRIQDLSVSYLKDVAQKEWPAMRQGESSPGEGKILSNLRLAVQDFQPRTDSEANLHAELLTEMNAVETNRELRLLAVDEGIPSLVWVVLVLGAILMVGFTYLFGIEPAWVHAASVAGLAILLSLVLHVIGVLNYPFNSGVQVSPEAFEQVLREIGDEEAP